MSSIIIAGRPNSELTSQCILLSEELSKHYPTIKFIKVLKHPEDWNKYSEEVCRLFGFSKEYHPLIFFSNGLIIGDKDKFFSYVKNCFNLVFNSDKLTIYNLTQENIKKVNLEYTNRVSGLELRQKIDTLAEKLDFEYDYNTLYYDYDEFTDKGIKHFYKYDKKFTPKDYIVHLSAIDENKIVVDVNKDKIIEATNEDLIYKEDSCIDVINSSNIKNKPKDTTNNSNDKNLNISKANASNENLVLNTKHKQNPNSSLISNTNNSKLKSKMTNNNTSVIKNNMNSSVIKQASIIEEDKQSNISEDTIEKKVYYYSTYKNFEIPYQYLKPEFTIDSNIGFNYNLLFNPYNTFYGEMILTHKNTLDNKMNHKNYNYKENTSNDKNINLVISITDKGLLPSLRKIQYDNDILKYVPQLIDNTKKTSLADENLIDILMPVELKNNKADVTNNFLSDHDIYYLIKVVKETNSIGTYKILPFGQTDYKKLNSNKLKLIPLPLKDINYKDIPLSFKIKQIVQKIKREKLRQIGAFKSVIDNESVNNIQYKLDVNFQIDILFDNEELNDIFSSGDRIKNDSFNFPHYIALLNKTNYEFLSIKNHIKNALIELDINNHSKKGLILLITTDYLFIAPLIKPYYKFNNELLLYPDPMFYAGIFNFPLIDAKWSETIERDFVKFNLIELLENCSSD